MPLGRESGFARNSEPYVRDNYRAVGAVGVAGGRAGECKREFTGRVLDAPRG